MCLIWGPEITGVWDQTGHQWAWLCLWFCHWSPASRSNSFPHGSLIFFWKMSSCHELFPWGLPLALKLSVPVTVSKRFPQLYWYNVSHLQRRKNGKIATKLLFESQLELSFSGSIINYGLRRWCSSKEFTCQCRRCERRLDLIPGSGKSPGQGNGNPLQYSCLENPMDRGAWWATVHGIAESYMT